MEKYELLRQAEEGEVPSSAEGTPSAPQQGRTTCLVKVLLFFCALLSLALLIYLSLPLLGHCLGLFSPPSAPLPPGTSEPADPFPPTIQCISDHASQGPCSSSALCCSGCCSRYGYCGTTPDHCGEGCQSTCTGNPPSGEAVSWSTIQCGFSASGPGEARLREIHSALNNAVSKMGIQFGESVSKVEVAAFLGQISHESDYLKAKREYCSLPGANPSCLDHYDRGSWCPEVQPAPGKHYYGRGFIQLTWNCNYDAAGKYLKRNLLADPDVVEYSDQVAWETAFWFWSVNNIASPARQGNFGQTTRLINSMECNGGNPGAQDSRVRRYQDLRKCLSLSVESDGSKLYC